MQDLQLVLIGIGALAIIGLVVHGVWANKRENQSRNRYLEQTNQSAAQQAVADRSDDPLFDGTQAVEDAYDIDDDDIDDSNDYSEDITTLKPVNAKVDESKAFDKTSFVETKQNATTQDVQDLGARHTKENIIADNVNDAAGQSKQTISSEPLSEQKPPEEVVAEPEPEEPNIILLHVKATGEGFFDGQALVASMKRYGLAFGKNDIYHCYENGDANKTIFSIANMLNPGTFPMSPIQNFETKGILLFMILSGEANSEQYFKKMLLTAQEIADDLGGHVLDDKRNLMTPNRLDLYRQQIRDSLSQ